MKLRFSFPQLLLAAFLGIGALLGTTALRGLFSLEALMAQSRDSTAQAIELSTAAQSLSERSQAMERAARQSLVLGDPQLRQVFRTARDRPATSCIACRTTSCPPRWPTAGATS